MNGPTLLGDSLTSSRVHYNFIVLLVYVALLLRRGVTAFPYKVKIKERVFRFPLSGHGHRYLPPGGLSSPCILQYLLDALDLKRQLAKICESCGFTASHSWILNVARAPILNVMFVFSLQ